MRIYISYGKEICESQAGVERRENMIMLSKIAVTIAVTDIALAVVGLVLILLTLISDLWAK